MVTPAERIRPTFAKATVGKRAVPVMLAIVAAALYFYRLNDTPMFVGGDEAFFAINSRSIATTARDLDGRLMPLFFRIDAHTWYQPVLVYLMAISFTIAQVSEWTLRAPTALIGVIDVLLVYAIGLRLFRHRGYAALAAAMLAIAPAHLILARQALDYVCPLPFVLGWLWCVVKAIDDDDVYAALGAGLLLGVGFYSYVASWILMPIYFVVTLVTMRLTGCRGRLLLAATAGFLLPFTLLLLWMRYEPATIAAIVSRYGFSDASEGTTLLQSVRGLLHYYVIQMRLSLYWSYFDPVFLFLAGSPNVTLSTGKAGVFLATAIVLLPVGIYDILRRCDRSLVLLAGFLTTPLAPVLINTGHAIQRELAVVVFGVLISAYGARRLLSSPTAPVRIVATVMLIAMPAQFAYFAADYFGAYRSRSANWIDPINFDAVARDVLDRDAVSTVPRIYLSEALDDVEARWRFYLAKYQREDLWQRTWIVDGPVRNAWSINARLLPAPLTETEAPAGSVFVVGAANPNLPALTRDGGCCHVVREINGATGEPTVFVVEQTQRR